MRGYIELALLLLTPFYTLYVRDAPPCEAGPYLLEYDKTTHPPKSRPFALIPGTPDICDLSTYVGPVCLSQPRPVEDALVLHVADGTCYSDQPTWKVFRKDPQVVALVYPTSIYTKPFTALQLYKAPCTSLTILIDLPPLAKTPRVCAVSTRLDDAYPIHTLVASHFARTDNDETDRIDSQVTQSTGTTPYGFVADLALKEARENYLAHREVVGTDEHPIHYLVALHLTKHTVKPPVCTDYAASDGRACSVERYVGITSLDTISQRSHHRSPRIIRTTVRNPITRPRLWMLVNDRLLAPLPLSSLSRVNEVLWNAITQGRESYTDTFCAVVALVLLISLVLRGLTWLARRSFEALMAYCGGPQRMRTLQGDTTLGNLPSDATPLAPQPLPVSIVAQHEGNSKRIVAEIPGADKPTPPLVDAPAIRVFAPDTVSSPRLTLSPSFKLGTPISSAELLDVLGQHSERRSNRENRLRSVPSSLSLASTSSSSSISSTSTTATSVFSDVDDAAAQGQEQVEGSPPGSSAAGDPTVEHLGIPGGQQKRNKLQKKSRGGTG